jgi:hypothetical protein
MVVVGTTKQTTTASAPPLPSCGVLGCKTNNNLKHNIMKFALLVSSLVCLIASACIGDLFLFGISVVSVFSSILLNFQKSK